MFFLLNPKDHDKQYLISNIDEINQIQLYIKYNNVHFLYFQLLNQAETFYLIFLINMHIQLLVNHFLLMEEFLLFIPLSLSIKHIQIY